MLTQMQSKFSVMSSQILTKIDDMGQRIDDLEKSIESLSGAVGAPSAPTTSFQQTQPITQLPSQQSQSQQNPL